MHQKQIIFTQHLALYDILKSVMAAKTNHSLLRLYFLTHFCIGFTFNIFGPLIPYLAQITGQDEVSFSYIFTIRGVGFFSSALLNKTVLSKYSFHSRMIYSLAITGITFILFYFTFPYDRVLMVVVLLNNLGFGSLDVLTSMCLVDAVKQNSKLYMSISYCFYGIGAVFGPIALMMSGVSVINWLGLCLILLACVYPLANQQQKEEISAIQMNQLHTPLPTHDSEEEQRFIGTHTGNYICMLFALYAGVTLSFRSWQSSFLVVEEMAGKDTAAFSVSLYSGVLTLFRFIFMFLNLDIYTLLQWASTGAILAMLTTFVAYTLNFKSFVTFGLPTMLGITFASYAPYLYVLPTRYQKQFSLDNTLNNQISYAVGEAVLSAGVGVAMEIIDPYMFFVCILIMALLNKLIFLLTIRLLDQQHQQIVK